METLKICDRLKHLLFLEKSLAEHFKAKSGESWHIAHDARGVIAEYVSSVLKKSVEPHSYSPDDAMQLIRDDIERQVLALAEAKGKQVFGVNDFDMPHWKEISEKSVGGLPRENQISFKEWYGGIKAKLESARDSLI